MSGVAEGGNIVLSAEEGYGTKVKDIYSGRCLVSVIMPVYNSEKYVSHAIESVLAQEFDGFELLLIDDGSSDDSGSICDLFAENDKRIRVFHIPNGGMCHARNFGIKQACGEYVAFCDNDDEFLPGLLSDNYELAYANGADCVRFGRRLIAYVGNSKVPHVSEAVPEIEAVLRGEEIDQELQSLFFGSNGVWNGLYRREFLLRYDIWFLEELRHGSEDILFNLEVFEKAETICLNAATYYVWTRRIGKSASYVMNDNYFVGVGLHIHCLKRLLEIRNAETLGEGFVSERMAWPFREVMGTATRLRWLTPRECKALFAYIRVIYEGYWTPRLSRRGPLYGKVLDQIMSDRVFFPMVSLYAWHVWQVLRTIPRSHKLLLQ